MEKRMPAVFVGHGSPMDAIINGPAREGWRKMGERIGKPKAIVAISAHWNTKDLHVRTAEENEQIYDMYGFPQELYEVKYAPKNDVEVAKKVLELFGPEATELNNWGIDHGVWSVLCNMYPDADVPVIMVSVPRRYYPEDYFEMGRKLASLRDEGIMILGSGNVVHNLQDVDWDMEGGHEYAVVFDNHIRKFIEKRNFKAVVNYHDIPFEAAATATGEHFYPLLTVLGAVSENDVLSVWNNFCELGAVSMTSYIFA